MADRKITDLTALAAGSQATGDLLTIVDVSEVAAADKNKKITVESLFNGIPSNVGIGTTATQQALTIDVNNSGTTQASFDGINIANTNTTANNGSAITFGQAVTGNSNARIGVIQTTRGASESQEMFFGLLSSGSYFERMRLTSDGKLGLGTSSPSYNMCIEGSSPIFDLYNTDATSNDSHSVTLQAYSPDTTRWNKMVLSASSIDFQIYGVTRTRIDSTGNLLVRRTTNTDNAALCVDQDASGGNVGISTVTDSTATRYHNMFRNGNGQVGAISTNGSATTYATSSDYRLKENVVDLDGAITRVKQLAPRRFNFIVDTATTVDGFLAHEAQTVVPEAVTGTHNEVDDDGNAVMQGIDQSKLVPLLTAALQEAIAKIETLETKVAALEAQ